MGVWELCFNLEYENLAMNFLSDISFQNFI